MSSVVRELITLWGFDIDQKPLKELDAGINTIKRSLQMIGVAVAAGTAAIGYLLNEAGEDEQTAIAFETMLGSAELAKQKLEELKDFALNTPFELTGLKDMAKRLLAFNFSADELIPTMKALGDISSGVGTDKLPQLILAFGQVKAATKLTGMELRQFTEAGVPLLDELAKVLGKDVKQIQAMVTAGQIGFPDVQKALFSLTGEGGRFFNLMEKQSKSLLGLWSNLKDWINLLAIDLGNELMPMAKELMAEFSEWARLNREIIKTNLTEFIRNLADMVFGLVNILKALYRVVNPVAQAFGGWNTALNITMKLFQGLMGLGLIYGIGLITKAVFGLTAGFYAMGNAVMIAQLKLMAIPLAIGAIVVAIALIAEDLIAFSQGRDSVFGRMMAGVDSVFSSLREKFGIFGEIGAFLINALLSPLRLVINGVKNIGVMIDMIKGKTGFINGIKEMGGNLANTFTGGFGAGGITAGMGAMGKVNEANAQYVAGNSPMVGLGGGLDKAELEAKKTGVKTENTVNLNVEGADPSVQMEMIKGTFAEQLNTMMRETIRDGAPAVEE